MRKDEQQSSQQLASERHTSELTAADTDDAITDDRQNSSSMECDELTIEPSLMSNHSAFISVSGSDGDSQQPTADNGMCHFAASSF